MGNGSLYNKVGADVNPLDKIIQATTDLAGITVDMNNYNKVLFYTAIKNDSYGYEFIYVNGVETNISGNENVLGYGMLTLVKNGTNVDVYYVDNATLTETLFQTFTNPTDMLMTVSGDGGQLKYLVALEVK